MSSQSKILARTLRKADLVAKYLWSRNTGKMSGGFRHVGKKYEISLVDKARRPDFDSEPAEDREGFHVRGCWHMTSTPGKANPGYDWAHGFGSEASRGFAWMSLVAWTNNLWT